MLKEPTTQDIINQGLEIVKIHNDILDGKDVDEKSYKKWHDWIERMYNNGQRN